MVHPRLLLASGTLLEFGQGDFFGLQVPSPDPVQVRWSSDCDEAFVWGNLDASEPHLVGWEPPATRRLDSFPPSTRRSPETQRWSVKWNVTKTDSDKMSSCLTRTWWHAVWFREFALFQIGSLSHVLPRLPPWESTATGQHVRVESTDPDKFLTGKRTETKTDCFKILSLNPVLRTLYWSPMKGPTVVHVCKKAILKLKNKFGTKKK